MSTDSQSDHSFKNNEEREEQPKPTIDSFPNQMVETLYERSSILPERE